MNMQKASIRKIATLVAVLAVALVAVPAFSATSPGSIAITSPKAGTADAETVSIEWVWKAGSAVSSLSKVDVQATVNGVVWRTVSSAVPIRLGTAAWDTKTWPDYTYALRVVVQKTTVKSAVVSPVLVDNTAPDVRITRPEEGQVLVEDEPAVQSAVVIGTATLEADARDALSGVEKVEWILDDAKIGEGAQFTYNFSSQPGQHVLTAVATDRARNSASFSISLIALPGPSVAGPLPVPSDAPNPVPSDVPSEVPNPVPSDVPSEVPNPVPSDQPNPVPSDVPNPVPSDVPVPLP